MALAPRDVAAMKVRRVLLVIYLTGSFAFAAFLIVNTALPVREYGPRDYFRIALLSSLWPPILVGGVMYGAHMFRRPGEEYDEQGRRID
jgi:hypothetical protein